MRSRPPETEAGRGAFRPPETEAGRGAFRLLKTGAERGEPRPPRAGDGKSRKQEAGNGKRKAESRKQETESRTQKAGNGKQKAESRKREAERGTRNARNDTPAYKQDGPTSLDLHQAEALAAQNAAAHDAGHLLGGHHLRFVARRLALLRPVGRKGRETDVRGRKARAGDHHMQPLLEVLDTQRLEEARHGVFRGRIARAARKPVQTGHRRDADDRTLRLLQVGKRIFAAVHRTPEIDIHQAVQHLQIDIVEERPHRDARIADEDIHTAELPDGRLDQRAALLGLRNIHAAVGRGPALLADRPGNELQLLHAARPEHHPSALRGVFVCHRFTDARRGARDDDDLLLECFHIFSRFLWFERFLDPMKDQSRKCSGRDTMLNTPRMR